MRNLNRPVLCMVGDGGFMFNASELSTAVNYGINVVTVVFRNDSYGNVAQDMNRVFGGTYQTTLRNPDFVQFARSFGAVGIRANNPLELETLIPEALERQAPCDNRRADGRHSHAQSAADCSRLLPPLDHASRRPHTLLDAQTPGRSFRYGSGRIWNISSGIPSTPNLSGVNGVGGRGESRDLPFTPKPYAQKL